MGCGTVDQEKKPRYALYRQQTVRKVYIKSVLY